MTFYTCLNFIPGVPGGRECRVCGKGIETHPIEMGTWTPPPVDDEYREKRGIENVRLRGPDDVTQDE